MEKRATHAGEVCDFFFLFSGCHHSFFMAFFGDRIRTKSQTLCFHYSVTGAKSHKIQSRPTDDGQKKSERKRSSNVRGWRMRRSPAQTFNLIYCSKGWWWRALRTESVSTESVASGATSVEEKLIKYLNYLKVFYYYFRQLFGSIIRSGSFRSTL